MKKPDAKIIGVIPARYASSRFPGKVLETIGEKPMIQHVYENACKSEYLEEVLVAVDDARVQAAVEGFGAPVVMTDPGLPSGTDRVAAAVRDRPVDIVCNIQGDEPFSNPGLIDEAIAPLLERPDVDFATLRARIHDPAGHADPGVVKCVVDRDNYGLYFSRSLIPYPRDETDFVAYEHVGIYVYRKAALLRFVSWAPSPLERVEGLEQLRILENGEKLYVAESRAPFYALSVDTPEDLEKARRFYRERQHARDTPDKREKNRP